MLTSLLNDLAELPDPGLLVLDDYHLVRSPEIHAVLTFLLDHLPPALHLVIATREDPPLPLPRLRVRGQLSEVRAADLRFTDEEAGEFLGESMGLRLRADQVDALVERTEGWAAGLQLAGLALRSRPDPAAFVAAFAGSQRLVADYLTAEVLDTLPESRRRFLLTTSVLDRLCAPLCDALLAPDGEASNAPRSGTSDSQMVLEELERANLFLVPLDDEGVWYRYHHLLSDALRVRLGREVGVDGTAALHRRAGAWLGRAGLLPEAIEHALIGRAFEEATSWIEALTPMLLAGSGNHRTLATWLSALPEAVVRTRPRLCLAQAWLLLPHFQLAPAAAWAEAAARAVPEAHDVDSVFLIRVWGSRNRVAAPFGSPSDSRQRLIHIMRLRVPTKRHAGYAVLLPQRAPTWPHSGRPRSRRRLVPGRNRPWWTCRRPTRPSSPPA